MTFRGWYQDFQPHVIAPNRIDHHALGDEYAKEILRFALGDDPDIVEVDAFDHMTKMIEQEARRRVKAWHQQAHKVLVRYRGKKRNKSASYAAPVIDPQTGTVTGRTYELTWDMPYDAFIWFWQGVSNRRQGANEAWMKAEAVRRAWENHPGAKTTRQAWESDGHSVDEIDLDAIFG